MTLDTLIVPGLRLGTCTTTVDWFSMLREQTQEFVPEQPDQQEHDALLRQLVELSTGENSLDWDALARVNIEGWGAEQTAE